MRSQPATSSDTIFYASFRPSCCATALYTLHWCYADFHISAIYPRPVAQLDPGVCKTVPNRVQFGEIYANPPYRCEADFFRVLDSAQAASATVQRRSSLLPTSAERFIKLHDGQQFLEPDLGQIQLALK